MEPMMFALMNGNKTTRTQSTAERELAEVMANFEQTAGSRQRAPKRGFFRGLGL